MSSDRPQRIPPEIESLFWDCDPEKVSWDANRAFIIRRILDSGDWQAMQWLRRAAGDEALRQWLESKQGAGLDPRKLRFWGLVLDLPVEEVDRWVAEARRSTWVKSISG